MTASANVRPAACRSRSRSSCTGGSIAAIAARAASSASAGARSISTSTLRRISRAAAASTSTATKSAAIESPSGKPAGRGDQPGEHGERAGEVAAEVERVRAQRLAAVAPRRPQRDDRAAEVDREHDPDDGEHPPARVDLALRAPTIRVDGERRDRDADEREHGRLRQCGEVLRLAVAVLVAGIGGPAGDADREEGQQRRDEVGAGVERLGDEPEAAAREAGAELERDESRRRADRDERGAALRRHAAKARSVPAAAPEAAERQPADQGWTADQSEQQAAVRARGRCR